MSRVEIQVEMLSDAVSTNANLRSSETGKRTTSQLTIVRLNGMGRTFSGYVKEGFTVYRDLRCDLPPSLFLAVMQSPAFWCCYTEH